MCEITAFLMEEYERIFGADIMNNKLDIPLYNDSEYFKDVQKRKEIVWLNQDYTDFETAGRDMELSLKDVDEEDL